MKGLIFVFAMFIFLLSCAGYYSNNLEEFEEKQSYIEDAIAQAYKTKDISVLDAVLEKHPNATKINDKFFDLYLELAPTPQAKLDFFHQVANPDFFMEKDIRTYAEATLQSILAETNKTGFLTTASQPITQLEEIINCMDYITYEACTKEEVSL